MAKFDCAQFNQLRVREEKIMHLANFSCTRPCRSATILGWAGCIVVYHFLM
jgi:hypothetical protein